MKMKLFFAVCAVCTAALLFSSFARRPANTISGYVHMYGNAPFSFPGFETDNGKRYTLVLDEKKSGTLTLEELESLQGQRVELHGAVRTESGAVEAGINRLKDGEFVVYSYKVIGNQ
ncbi:MAG TPA: hypothetical protein DCL73_16940 [Treponema sp.]|nr:hypothetical protein [Treponema sp.]